MPSRALKRWQHEQRIKLDDLEIAQRAIGGTGPGRRYVTQLNHAYLVMLAAQWQDFCRRLHTEAADAIVDAIQPASVRHHMHTSRIQGRSLDRGNAGPAVIGSDFGRFGPDFWDLVDRQNPRNAGRRHRLEQLHRWRNGVAHQDFNWSRDDMRILGRTRATLNDVKIWRDACNALAREMDRAVAVRIIALVGQLPW